MTTRSRILGIAIGTALLSPPALADQPVTPRIGVLVASGNSRWDEGLRNGLHDLGYVEGKTIVIDWRRSAGTVEDLRSAAAELVRSKVDLLVASGTPAARAALEATSAIPVVFTAGDPVASGLAGSLARPGGNGTGVATLTTELIAKCLELLHEVVPGARRIVYLKNSSNPNDARQLEEAQKGARTLGVRLVTLDARNAGELDAALRTVPRSGADGVLVAGDFLFATNERKIARTVRKAKLPAIVSWMQNPDDGLLMSYGVNLKELGRHAAIFVDKILKGAKPADLPIEQINKYELVIDLRVANEQGIKVPQELLLRADEVIR